MFVFNEDKSIYVTRGDVLFFSVTAVDDGEPYIFQAGDLVRIKVFGKKNAENVVLQKDFPVSTEVEEVAIYLTKEDTKIGPVISKPTDYWYEVELNPFNEPKTIIGYDEEGPKIFKLFPEGADVDDYEPPAPEDIPIVDETLDLASQRPVQNHAITKEIMALKDELRKIREQIYPVGSIYLSVTEVDPTALFGGLWMRMKDRFLLGAGDRFAAGEMDGEEVVTLNDDQIPYHRHEVQYMVEGEGVAPEGHTLLAGTYETAQGQFDTMFITGGGGDQAHNNMPPYLAVYMWKRIE